jgi:transcriptional regulator NrdR family protein
VRRGEAKETPTIDRRRAREDCKMREPTLEAIRMVLVTMMRGI